MKILAGTSCAVLLAIALVHSQGLPPASSCESLESLALPHTQITRAQSVPAGRFAGTPAGVAAPGAPTFLPYSALPAFCRVAATLTPSADSDIKIEVWLPATGWNGKFEGLGNGGWAGTISVQLLARAVARGYAVAMTDTGHAGQGGDGSFAFNHPEKLVDFGYRAVHEMTVQAKALVRAYYGTAPRTSYWDGCSTGGRQGLVEAQRYPDDYDGIAAGAPANYMSHLLAASIWVAHATLKDQAGYIPPEKYAALHAAAVEACDALDGVKDGVIDDPTRCHFDPKTIQCRGTDGPTCLTGAQVEAARRIYAPATNPRTGAEIFPGLEPGSELGWAGLAGGPAPLSIAADYFKYVVFKDPAWDFRTFDFDKDVARADSLDHGEVNAIDPNLKAFFSRGGKLLMYHGWADMLIAPRNTISYYTSVIRALRGAAKVEDSMRLFMVPGMAHCGGGEGPSNFDKLTPLEQWVEQKKAPDRILVSRPATKEVAAATRPVCPYPLVAVYSGSGSTDDAANFVCKAR
jgi:feruloyl esterase